MKRTILIAILLSALTVTLFTSAIRPVKAYIYNYDWIGQVHYEDLYWEYGRDYYWYYETVFEEGSTATLLVTVYNSYGYPYPDLNVSAVKVLMDWNINYSSTECSETAPVAVPYASMHTFTVTFEVPPISVASNLMWHSWRIYVEHVNATSGPVQVSLHDMWYGSSDFIVFSTVQKEVITLWDEIDMLFDWYGSYPYFSDTEAGALWLDGRLHYELGEYHHTNGLFDEAQTAYETALDLFEQAIDAEAAYDLYWQDFWDDYDRRSANLSLWQDEAWLEVYLAEAHAYLMEANASMIEADAAYSLANAAMTQAYAFIIFGFGFLFFGIAAIVWAFKRPGRP